VTGLEVVAAAAVAYLMRKAGRVGERVDEIVDEAVDQRLDRLAEVVGGKLGDDPGLAKLDALGEESSDVTRQRVALAIVDAAQDDPDFAAKVTELVTALQAQETATGQGGSTYNTMNGSVHGTMIQGRDISEIHLGDPRPHG